MPNTTTLTSQQALHTPKHYYTVIDLENPISSHVFMSFKFVWWNPNNPEGENNLHYLLPFIYLLLCCETEISGAVGAIIHTIYEVTMPWNNSSHTHTQMHSGSGPSSRLCVCVCMRRHFHSSWIQMSPCKCFQLWWTVRRLVQSVNVFPYSRRKPSTCT